MFDVLVRELAYVLFSLSKALRVRLDVKERRGWGGAAWLPSPAFAEVMYERAEARGLELDEGRFDPAWWQTGWAPGEPSW